MWAKIIHIHPSQRRFKQTLTLTGELTTQELSGVQVRDVIALGCTHAEYATVIRESEATAFQEGLQHQCQDQIHPGIELFSVSGSGSKKLKSGITDTGSFQYQKMNC